MALFSCPICGAILVEAETRKFSCPDCGGFSLMFTPMCTGFSIETPGYAQTDFSGSPELPIERTPVPRAFTDAFREEDLTP
jgi:hypothetical protein